MIQYNKIIKVTSATVSIKKKLIIIIYYRESPRFSALEIVPVLGLVPFSCNVRKRHYSEYLLVNYRPLNCTVLKSIVTIKIHTEPL